MNYAILIRAAALVAALGAGSVLAQTKPADTGTRPATATDIGPAPVVTDVGPAPARRARQPGRHRAGELAGACPAPERLRARLFAHRHRVGRPRGAARDREGAARGRHGAGPSEDQAAEFYRRGAGALTDK